MKQRALGKTGLLVSEVSFGTGDNAGLLMNGTRQERTAAVARALELGVNYFDTSPDYGKGVAEENLGQILRELGSASDGAIVATKVEIMNDDLDDIAGAVERSLDASLRRLGRERVEVMMIHNAPRLERNPAAAYWTPLTPADMIGPGLEGLERVRAKGKAAHFGFTCEPAEAAAVRPLLDTDAFGAINIRYNLVNPTAGMKMPAGIRFGADYDDYDGIITYAAARGVGVAVIRPLAGGALVPAVLSNGPVRHRLAGGMYTNQPETFEPETRRGRAFGFLQTPARSLARAAFQFVFMNPSISTVIGGFSDLAQLEELVDTANGPPLTAAELAQIRAVYARNFDLETV